MRNKSLFAIFVLVLTATGWAAQKRNGPKYDKTNEVTIRGVVQEVKEFECPASGGVGAHLVLKTGDNLVLVHLALSKFLKEYGFEFAKGDELVVVGAKAKVDEQDGILARTIERGNQTLTFRDKDGKPLW